MIKRDRRVTLPKIAAYFNAGPPTSVTLQTIQRNIIDMVFRSRKPTRVSLLTARYKALRLTWARQHRQWTVDDWKYVTWSDESRFKLNRADGRLRTLPLASKTPDMSIIEHICHALERVVQKISPPLLTPADLWTALQYSRCQLSPALLQTLIEYLPHHVAALLRTRGGPTLY
ncbi:uncharacterized protein TNCV_2691041 [Trichonephila clavipes]|uniref:Transposase Tc1-like domain-containing protein n=1 Tax=Trichonephila clavipes TaxID=2585209 RepID=A0A8X6VYP5_TRICX|nr:uncharacterized protein TNCV_2691041 [Trichonephila clavipes]